MEQLLQQILNILTVPPGNLIVHLILAFTAAAALQTAWILRRPSPGPAANRMILALVFLLVGQLIMFLASGMAWQELATPHSFMPPVDRAVLAYSLIWIVWLWVFPRPSRAADAVLVLLNLLVIVLFAFTLTGWLAQDPTLPFNGSMLDWGWGLLTSFLALAGLFLLVLVRPLGWGVGFVFLLANLAGSLLHLLYPPASGDFSGAVRLAQLCTYPLLPLVAQRIPVVVPPQAPAVQVIPAERKSRVLETNAVRAWASLAGDPAGSRRDDLVRALAHTLKSDLCFLLTPDAQNGHVQLANGYDLIREERLPSLSIESTQIPILLAALQKNELRSFSVQDERSASDRRALAAAIGVDAPGSVMLLPIGTGPAAREAALFINPYSSHDWSAEDENLIRGLEGPLAALLQAPDPDIEARLRKAILEVTDSRAQLDALRQDNQALLSELAAMREEPPANPQADLQSLVELQKETQRTVDLLQQENERLTAALEAASTTARPESQVQSELRASLVQVAQLQNQLADANTRMLTLQQKSPETRRLPAEDMEMITSIVQELRQPLSSIAGYTDLLMGESVGILGALQRKFMERIKASTERMNDMVNDLLQATTRQTAELAPAAVDLSEVIDQALSDASLHLRKKNLAMRVDLPDEMPRLVADRDALQQILTHLLRNASEVTPPEGSIRLMVRTQEAAPGDEYALIKITDSGGGIASDDLPRVFSRRYRADNPILQGVGDAGLGLSIAKALVEAHGGRIWVESDHQHTSTFSILLPIQPESPEEPAGRA